MINQELQKKKKEKGTQSKNGSILLKDKTLVSPTATSPAAAPPVGLVETPSVLVIPLSGDVGLSTTLTMGIKGYL